jgi:hypothetical protein
MNRFRWGLVAALAAVSTVATAAHASTAYDTSLASPGLYFGSGNSGQNFGWTVNTVNGVELGLTTIHAYVGGLHPTVNNVYNVPTGDAGPAHTNRAYWNFDFSVNLQGAGLTIGDITPTLTVQNLGNGTQVSGNPLLAFNDTQGYGSSGVDSPYTSSDYAFQNSENLVFGQFAPLSFDENADDTFLITLALSGANGFIGSVSETVVVGAGATPLPASLPLFASGLAALGFLKRRKKRVNIPAAA